MLLNAIQECYISEKHHALIHEEMDKHDKFKEKLEKSLKVKILKKKY